MAQAADVEVKGKFTCSPAQFDALAKQYRAEHSSTTVYGGVGDVLPNALHIRRFVFWQEPPTDRIWISVVETGGGNSEFFMRVDREQWPTVEPLWRDLCDYIREHIGESGSTSAPAEEKQIESISEATAHTQPSLREPSEDLRIRTTLITWAKKKGKCRSYADAAAQIGGVDLDTRKNHEKKGWLYTDKQIEQQGGYEYLWRLYTTTRRIQ